MGKSSGSCAQMINNGEKQREDAVLNSGQGQRRLERAVLLPSCRTSAHVCRWPTPVGEGAADASSESSGKECQKMKAATRSVEPTLGIGVVHGFMDHAG